jgi:acid phosphatase
VTHQYGQGLQVYAATHGSANAYLELAAGSAPYNGQSDNGNCNGNGCAQPYTRDNLVREFANHGLTWRGYFQSMPYAGYMGTQSGNYVERHNPFPYLSDVYYNGAEQLHMVPWNTNLATDLANNNVANYTLLVPDLTHDGHDPQNNTALALQNADAFLAHNVPVLLHSRYFQPGGDGVLIITFDESDLYNDNSCSSNVSQGCGGHIFFALIGPNARRNYTTSTHLMQRDILRGTCNLLGLTQCPGDGAQGIGVGEFFAQGVQVMITSPYDYYPDAGPYTNLVGNASSSYGPITWYAVYVDGVLYSYAHGAPTLQMWVPTPMGLHAIALNAWDSTGRVASTTVHVTRTY